jgi:hypothetical protein
MLSQQLPRNGLECTLPLPAEREDWMAIFHVYGDESGKLSGNADRTSFCGYVAHVSQWQMFAANWNACRFKWQVPAIHMARIMYPDNKDDAWKKVKQDWGDAWEKKRDALVNELSEIIRESAIVCVGAVVDSKHFRLLADNNPEFKKLHRDPIHLAFHLFVMGGIQATEVIDKVSPIGVVIDNDKEFAMRVYEQFEGLRSLAATDSRFTKVRERMHSISFVDDDFYPAVQAADMIAYEARRVMVERITNPDYTSELYDNLTFLRTHQPRFYTPQHLDELLANLKQGITNGKIKL